jgi:hypothetical protein
MGQHLANRHLQGRARRRLILLWQSHLGRGVVALITPVLFSRPPPRPAGRRGRRSSKRLPIRRFGPIRMRS